MTNFLCNTRFLLSEAVMAITFRSLFWRADFNLYSPLAPTQQNPENNALLERKSFTQNASPHAIKLNTTECGQN